MMGMIVLNGCKQDHDDDGPFCDASNALSALTLPVVRERSKAKSPLGACMVQLGNKFRAQSE